MADGSKGALGVELGRSAGIALTIAGREVAAAFGTPTDSVLLAAFEVAAFGVSRARALRAVFVARPPAAHAGAGATALVPSGGAHG